MIGRQRMARLMSVAVSSVVVISVIGASPAAADPPRPDKRPAGEKVTVMTRNIYLGADLGPAFEAEGTAGFLTAIGEILDQVDQTNMKQRAKGLAREIRNRRPDLVGLQEAALWRVGPLNLDAALEQKPVASEVYQDFIEILLDRVNRRQRLYRVAFVAEEFDFEAPGDMDGNPDTGPLGADSNGRLTMRDAILVRRHAGIKIRKEASGHFTKENSFSATVGGLVDVTSVRGWQRMNVKVRNSPWFRFGNVHLEAFDDRTERPSIRALQAQEFADAVRVGQRRTADSRRMPLVSVGDYNSDKPGLVKGDGQAFKVMLRNGFVDIGTTSPWSCCIAGSHDMQSGGSIRDFDHRVDQVWTNTPGRVHTLKTWVTGRKQSNGFWHSDHAGVVARLWISR